MPLKPLALALVVALLPSTVLAEDLVQTYQLAKDGDPKLKAAEANRRIVQEGVSQARAARLPQIGASGSYTITRNDGRGSQTSVDPITGERIRVNGDNSSNTRALEAGVSGSMPLFDRTLSEGLKQARALSKAEDFQVVAAGTDLMTRTSAAYFNTLTQLETLSAAKAAEAALKKQYDYAAKRLEVGLAPITDMHEARAQYENARANTILARTAVEDAFQSLIEITGTKIFTLNGLPNSFKPVLPDERNADAWVDQALQNNPSLLATQSQIEAAQAGIGAARAARLPKVSLRGGYGYSKNSGDSSFSSGGSKFSNPIDSSGWGPNIGVAVSVPLWTSGGNDSRVREALARKDVAEDQLEAQRRALVRNTRGAYNTLVSGISEIEARRLALVSAQSAYDASQVGLEVGTRTVLDVLINQQNLFNAQRAYAQSKYNFLQNRLLLEQAAGNLTPEDLIEVNRYLSTSISLASAMSAAADSKPAAAAPATDSKPATPTKKKTRKKSR